MERKALNSLGYMELAAFFVFGTFLLGLYYDIVWLQWVTAILFILPMAGVLRYPSRCKERQEPLTNYFFEIMEVINDNKCVAQGAAAWQEKETREQVMRDLESVHGYVDSYFQPKIN